MRISKRRSLTPDVLVVTAEACRRMPHYFAPEEVALAVEIVSPTSTTMDRVTKPALYAQAGIPNYWRIETERPERVAVHVYALATAGNVYAQTGEFTKMIDLRQPWRIRIPIADIVPRTGKRES